VAAARLQLLWFGTRTALRQTLAGDRTITINDVILQLTDVDRDLGVLIDSELSMKQQVNRVASTCFYHLRRLNQTLHDHTTIEAKIRRKGFSHIGTKSLELSTPRHQTGSLHKQF